MSIFQKDGSQVLKKQYLSCKTGKRQGEDLHLKGTEKQFKISSYLKSMSEKMEVEGLLSGRNLSNV